MHMSLQDNDVIDAPAKRATETKGTLPGKSVRILVVDDDPDICETLVQFLQNHEFQVFNALSAAEARIKWVETSADLVLLDLNMPGEDGLSLARWLRTQERHPGIVMLTAIDSVLDRVVGLELGADDYITKPCNLRELLARMRSVLRRIQKSHPLEEPGNRVRFGRCVLDIDACKLIGPSGEPLPFTAMECELLRAFSEHPNKVLSRERLLDLAHNRGREPFDRSIDIRITRIRRKIEIDSRRPRVIRTVRGAGYMFVPE